MSTTSLKILAMILMVIDHIGLFIPGTPILLRWIGRCSAPIFIYCLAIGLYHTKNRKKYLFRLYISGVIMGIINFILNSSFANPYRRTSGNIFVTFFIIGIAITILENTKYNVKNKILISFLMIVTQLSFSSLSKIIYSLTPIPYISSISNAILPSFLTCEGGIFIIALGIILYFCKKDLKTTFIGYSIYCLLYLALTLQQNTLMLSSNVYPISYYLFKINYQWLQVFALPIILLYNGKRGKNLKYFFYIFYPLHTIILFYLGNFIN